MTAVLDRIGRSVDTQHPSYFDLAGVLDAIPDGRHLAGVWIQTTGDADLLDVDHYVVSGTEVRVGVQVQYVGMARAFDGAGTCVRDATNALIASLRIAYARQRART